MTGAQKLENNIWKYGLLLITNKRTYMTILAVYLLTLPDATPKTVGLMTLIGNLAGFMLEIPSGYISDKMGHKNALVLSRWSLLISTTFFLIGTQVWMFILGSVFFSVALAFMSGTGSAFMHETLRALGRESEYSKIMGRLGSIGFAVPIALIVAIPFLVSFGFRVAFAVALIIDIVGLIVATSLVAPKKTEAQIKEIGIYNFKQVVKDGYEYGFLKYALFIGVMMGFILGAGTFKPVYQDALGVPVIYFGVFWAMSRVLVSIFLLFNDKIKGYFSFHKFLFIKMIIAIGLIAGLAVFSSPIVIVIIFIFISAFNWSFKEAENNFMLDIIHNSNFKASLLSMKALISTLFMGIVSYFIGYLVLISNYDFAFGVLSIIFGIILLGLFAFIHLSTKKKVV